MGMRMGMGTRMGPRGLRKLMQNGVQLPEIAVPGFILLPFGV